MLLKLSVVFLKIITEKIKSWQHRLAVPGLGLR
jgi:hypothetical protein